MKNLAQFVIVLLTALNCEAFEFKALTFNAWVLEDPIFGYELSKETDQRLQLMPEMIASTGADIVMLQEIWSADKRDWLISEFAKLGYGFHAYHIQGTAALRGRLGNGLLILSRFQLDPEIQILHFSEYTRVEEFFAQKGAIKTRALIPTFGWIDIFNTHLGAVTANEVEFNAIESSVKQRQVEELADFISQTASSDFAILGADLNSHYFLYKNRQYLEEYSPEYSLITCYGKAESEGSCLGLRDTYRDIHGFESSPIWTFSNYPTDSGSNQIFKFEPKGVIDYIFATPHPQVVGKKSKVVFTNPIESKVAGEPVPKFLSDHGGVLTTFKVR